MSVKQLVRDLISTVKGIREDEELAKVIASDPYLVKEIFDEHEKLTERLHDPTSEAMCTPFEPPKD